MNKPTQHPELQTEKRSAKAGLPVPVMNQPAITTENLWTRVSFSEESKILSQRAKLEKNWSESRRALCKIPLHTLIALPLLTRPPRVQITVAHRDKSDESSRVDDLPPRLFFLGLCLRETFGRRKTLGQSQKARGERNTEADSDPEAEKGTLFGTSCFSPWMSHAYSLFCSLYLHLHTQ